MPGKWTSITPPFGDPRYGVGAPRARPPERSGASGPPRATAMGGPAGRSAPVYPKISLTRWRRRGTGAPAGAERGVGAPASDGDGGSGGAKPPGLPKDIFDALEERLLFAVGFFVQLLLRQDAIQLFKYVLLFFGKLLRHGDARNHIQVAMSAAVHARHALAAQLEACPGLCARGHLHRLASI